MTFIAPAHPADPRGAPFFFGRKTARPKDRLRIGDEDGARRALGSDGSALPASPRMSIEHLARIALG